MGGRCLKGTPVDRLVLGAGGLCSGKIIAHSIAGLGEGRCLTWKFDF